MKKSPVHIFSSDELTQVLAAHMPVETFGPQSEHPFIAFTLQGTDARLGPRLSELPCPVIGIGSGALSPFCDTVLGSDKTLETIAGNILRAPLAAMILVQHLRASEPLSLRAALTAESFAYGCLQTGPEFKTWLDGYDAIPLPASENPDVIAEVKGNTLAIILDRPDTRNAIGTDMRDALCEALDLAIADSEISKIMLTGSGRTFSTGGAIEEFGEVSDPATAHWIRSLRLPAARLVQLADKLHVHVNGAAIGAGAEIAAFGTRVTAASNAWFQLPELKYGLIPGAGGTVSIAHRIGRQRTAYMALSMEKIRAAQALDWGLIDAIID